jgi:ArsR family transcriptional regulator
VKLDPLRFGKAIADGTRQRIMRFCCCEWRAVSDIARAVGVRQPTASHHLSVLRQARLVHQRRDGKLTYYTLDQSKVVACCGKLMIAFAPEEKGTRVLAKTSRE